ncbi:type II toxin-antitoxin system HipA family toxin [Dasania marina]|uniref:type II toxin-antitoxin system HipA family toxin n=1 Tax=Dasania marina TaxID=471499 RepID=UPI0030D74DE1|tara:strand:- start:3874 stop:5061 length:1188 start_codon:yes stop_codon:yes gene_type:complete
MKLPNRIKRVEVSAFGLSAGVLEQPAHFAFEYTHDNPVSLTMDYKSEPFNLGAIHPVFAQNLPEGYVRRYLHEKLLRHAQVNDLYLLALQRDKTIGHLAFESGLELPVIEQLSLDEILTWSGKEALFPQLLERYYLEGVLSGVQPKVMVPIDKRSAINQDRVIVKTFDDEFDNLTVNEFVCMTAAKDVGLSPPRFWLSDDKQCFVIERFDIKDGEQLAFEDFTVLMGKPSDHKYQSSYEQLLRAIRLYTKSQAQVDAGFRYIVFNCLIGNGDAHLKNFALQYGKGRESIELTPPYDITHTPIYETLDNNLALKMRGTKLFPNKADLVKLGRDNGVKKPEQVIEAFAQGIRDSVEGSDVVGLMAGLKESIQKSVSAGLSGATPIKGYSHQKNRKHK